MDKDKIIEIGKYLNTKYIVIRNVDKNDKLDKQDKYIQLLYDNYLDLKITNNNLNKGIDDLIEKYNERFERKGFYLDVENTMICEFIKDLKKLKGE